MAATTNTGSLPPNIVSFFDGIYQESLIKETVERGVVKYFIEGRGVSLLTDPFRGFHIVIDDTTDATLSKLECVKHQINNLLETLKEQGSFDSVWVDISLEKSPSAAMFGVLPDSFEMKNVIQDTQKNVSRHYSWINPDKESTIPPGATHNLGATALIVDSAANKVLLVVNQRRQQSWNPPGGSYDFHDGKLSETALREAEEEAGIEINRDAITNSMLVGRLDFPYNQFAKAINETWAFFIDGLSEQPLNPPLAEIKHAEWLDINAVLESGESLNGYALGDEIKIPLRAAIEGIGFSKVLDKGWMIVHAPKRLRTD